MKPWEKYGEEPKKQPWERYGSDFEVKPRQKADTPISGPMEALMSGVSFGWSDELAGLAGGIADWTKGKGFKGGYERRKGAAKLNLENFSEDSPVTSTTLQIIGGLAAGRPSAGFAPAPTLRGRVQQGVQVGAPIGALAGAGGADGDVADIMVGAGTGAALGAGVGAALPAISQGVTAGARHAANSMGMRPAETVASEKMLASLARDEVSPQQLLSRIPAAGGKPEMLMDMAGESTRRSVRTALSRPGEASNRGVQAITERQAGQAERLGDDLAMLSQSRNFHGTMDALARQRSAEAAPLYRQAFDDPSPVWNERIQQFIESPEAQQGLRRGLMIQRREALASNEPFNPRSYGVTGFNDAGDPIVTGTPNLRTLDAIKRGMDDMLEQYRDRMSGRLVLDEAGRALQAVRRSFMDEVDRAAPEVYRQARAAWAGPSQARDALEAGRQLFRMEPERIAQRVQQMPAADQEFFRAGAVRAIRDKITSAPDGADLVRRIFGTPKMRAQIEAVFPSRDAFLAFQRAMERETAMLRNARFVSPNTNSQTFLRQMDAADAAPNPVMEGLAGMMQGQSARQALMGALAGRATSRLGGYTPEVSDRLIQSLMSTDPAVQRQALTGLMNFPTTNPRADLLGGRTRAGLLTGGAAPFGSRE